jgi:sulfotransferase
MKTINFISGLPRSGTSLISNILKQNPSVHSETISSLSSIIETVNNSWYNFESNQIYDNTQSKIGILKSSVQGYYQHTDKSIIFDRSLNWIPLIGLVESILQKQVKILVCVRNPAEILSSFERIYKEYPLEYTQINQRLRENSSIASRAYHYAGPEGILGTTHRNLKDAIVMDYKDRLLFVDYNLYCGSPKSQTKRIYDFFEMEHFDHDFKNVVTDEYNNKIPNFYRLKPELLKTTVNCVQYLGLELYEQYNREIFWNAWI